MSQTHLSSRDHQSRWGVVSCTIKRHEEEVLPLTVAQVGQEDHRIRTNRCASKMQIPEYQPRTTERSLGVRRINLHFI